MTQWSYFQCTDDCFNSPTTFLLAGTFTDATACRPTSNYTQLTGVYPQGYCNNRIWRSWVHLFWSLWLFSSKCWADGWSFHLFIWEAQRAWLWRLYSEISWRTVYSKSDDICLKSRNTPVWIDKDGRPDWSWLCSCSWQTWAHPRSS